MKTLSTNLLTIASVEETETEMETETETEMVMD